VYEKRPAHSTVQPQLHSTSTFLMCDYLQHSTKAHEQLFIGKTL